ncbi:MAG: beta-N-acetylhexosaminidase, partial [Eubacteriales bacterium]|nr:beta-N-acetylhexosaminidase [Eubacteriales bacterium]
YNFKLDEAGREIYAEKTEEQILKINATKEKIEIVYKEKSAFFRAIGIIAEKEQKGIFEFKEESKVWFDFNGFMLDCSRNGVVNVSYAKKIIEQLALAGQNVFMLYMEDTFQLDSEEYFGYLRGAFSKEELKEIDDYGYKFGVEIIPCIQTLAHLDQFFMWEHIAEKYADIDNILNIGSEDVKKFLENVIKQLSETFRSKRIHIGMDEAYNLGRGKYAEENGLKHKTEIMREHLNNMLEICNKYNVKPIIWDDMFFSNYSRATNDGYKIPDGIDLMYWDYYNNNIAHYEENFEIRGKITNKKIMFAGGSWRWIGYASHHEKTLASTNASLMACKKNGINEVMTTAWADDGCECPVTMAIFGSILFAEHQYNYEINLDEFKDRLKFITKMDFENFMKVQEYDILPSMQNKSATVTPSKYTLYEDPLCS